MKCRWNLTFYSKNKANLVSTQHLHSWFSIRKFFQYLIEIFKIIAHRCALKGNLVFLQVWLDTHTHTYYTYWSPITEHLHREWGTGFSPSRSWALVPCILLAHSTGPLPAFFSATSSRTTSGPSCIIRTLSRDVLSQVSQFIQVMPYLPNDLRQGFRGSSYRTGCSASSLGLLPSSLPSAIQAQNWYHILHCFIMSFYYCPLLWPHSILYQSLLQFSLCLINLLWPHSSLLVALCLLTSLYFEWSWLSIFWV